MISSMASQGERLPLLVSVPHGGLQVPSFLRSQLAINRNQILVDGDTWSQGIFNYPSEVEAFISAPLARAVLDLNRAPDDLPPLNSDGVVKTHTVEGDQVWQRAEGLAQGEVERLLKDYYTPYHQKLTALSRLSTVKAALDCHTMLPRAPSNALNPGSLRPLVCLSNLGSSAGGKRGDRLSATPNLLKELGGAIVDRFKEAGIIGAEHRGAKILAFNDPFRGGYITSSQARLSKLPWIQVELNRSLYLFSPPQGEEPDPVTGAKIEALRRALLLAFTDFCVSLS